MYLPNGQDVPLDNLQPPFSLHIGHMDLSDLVTHFDGVIGKDGELIHTGDFVRLSSCQVS